MLEPEVLGYMDAGKNYDFSKDIFPLMLRDGKRLCGNVIADYWTDIGNLQQYQQANYDALTGTVRTQRPRNQIGPSIWVGDGCGIDRSATIRGDVHSATVSRSSPGALIEGPARIGSCSIVEAGARMHRTVLWEDVYIGEEVAA